MGKAMKAMKKSIVATGKRAKSLVFRGTKVKTSGGLTKDKLMRNKRGKLVSKKANTSGKRAYKNIKDWTSSLAAARKALQVTGFVAVNGKTHQGKALYAKSKALYAEHSK